MTTITTLPDAPSRTDPATFSTKSDALLGALATFVSETNTVAGECVTNAATATTKAGEAVISAAAAAASAATANTKAGEASVSASSASGSAGTANTKAGEASASAIAAAASAVTANTKAGEAAASAASIAGGPVASVNGRTGVVTGVQDSLVSGTSIKTINSTSLLGSGDIAITGNATHTGDATGDTALTVVKINGTLLSGLATGLLKNTTGTGVPSIAIAETDYVTPTGSGTLTNKAIALGSNTVSGTIAQFNTAVTDADLAILGANTFTAAQIYGDQQHSRAMFLDCGLTVVDKGNSSTTTQTYDYTAGSVQTSTATGNHTIATSNWPPTGNLGQILILLTNGGAFTLTWPAAINWIKPDGTTTTSISIYLAALTGRTALQASGTDQILLWSRDAGTTIYGKLV